MKHLHLPEIALPVLNTFEDKSIWKIDSPKTAALLLKHLLQQKHSVFDFSFIDPNSRDGGLFLKGENNVNLAFGTRSKVEAWVSFSVTPAGPNIGELSLVDGLATGRARDCNGNSVGRDNLQSYDGYAEYKGQGDVCHIHLLEAYEMRQGFGSRALRYLQNHYNFEIIELEMMDTAEGQLEFYEKNGFTLTEINTEDDERCVMVWNNPRYALS